MGGFPYLQAEWRRAHEMGVLPHGQDTHTLRLTSELVDLRVGYAYPFAFGKAKTEWFRESPMLHQKEKCRPTRMGGLHFWWSDCNENRTYSKAMPLLIDFQLS